VRETNAKKTLRKDRGKKPRSIPAANGLEHCPIWETSRGKAGKKGPKRKSPSVFSKQGAKRAQDSQSNAFKSLPPKKGAGGGRKNKDNAADKRTNKKKPGERVERKT